jgi:hydrogenase maturation protease
MARVLVAGVGNIFLGDDAFGCEVLKRLTARAWPEGVDVVDFGIRALDLAFALESGRYRSVILVDLCPRGKEPGAVFVLEPDPAGGHAGLRADAHGLSPVKVLAMMKAEGKLPPNLRLVGCEPSPVDDFEEMRNGLSEPVRAAVPRAADLVARLVEEELCTSSR